MGNLDTAAWYNITCIDNINFLTYKSIICIIFIRFLNIIYTFSWKFFEKMIKKYSPWSFRIIIRYKVKFYCFLYIIRNELFLLYKFFNWWYRIFRIRYFSYVIRIITLEKLLKRINSKFWINEKKFWWNSWSKKIISR